MSICVRNQEIDKELVQVETVFRNATHVLCFELQAEFTGGKPGLKVYLEKFKVIQERQLCALLLRFTAVYNLFL